MAGTLQGRVWIVALGLALAAPAFAPLTARAQEGETEECPDPEELEQQIQDKKKEKKDAEKDVEKKQKEYDKVQKKLDRFKKWYDKNKDKQDKPQQKKAMRKKQLELLREFKDARNALNEAKEKLEQICKELEELEKKKEECADPDQRPTSTTAEARPASAGTSGVWTSTSGAATLAAADLEVILEYDPWYDWMAWYDLELDVFPDCEADYPDTTLYHLETGELCVDPPL